MSEASPQQFCILFNGELRSGASRQAALDQLNQLTNLSPEELLDALFSIKPVIINCVASQELADTYLQAFGDAGLIVEAQAWDESHEDIINVELDFGHYAPKERTQNQPNYIVDLEDQAQSDNRPTDADANYHLVFSGKLRSGFNKTQVVENICRLTDSRADRVVEEIFSIVPVIIYRHNSRERTDEYFEVFSTAGLSLEIKESKDCKDILAESSLRVRHDKPTPRPDKRIKPFSLALAAFALLGAIAWSFVHTYFDGFLNSEPSTRINIELTANTAQQPAPTNDESKQPEQTEPQLPTPEPDQPKTPEPQQEPPQDAIAEPELMDKPSVITETTPPASAVPAKPMTKAPAKSAETLVVKSKSQQQAEETYFMTLLSWFARPEHQSYDAKTRALNLEGEIELAITIARNGDVITIEVLRSTSEELTKITRETAERASPYPSIPSNIKGDSYRFKLPLKYTLKDS